MSRGMAPANIKLRSRSPPAVRLLLIVACHACVSDDRPGIVTPPDSTQPPDSAYAVTVGWAPPQMHPHVFPGIASHPAIVERDGDLYMVAGAADPQFTDIFFSVRRGGVWSDHENLSRSSEPSSRPVLSFDSAGALHAIWGERRTLTNEPLARPSAILHSIHEAGGWSTPEVLFNHPLTNRTVDVPATVAVSAGGDLHIVFATADSITIRPTVYHARWRQGSWTRGKRVVDGLYPDVAAGPSGEIIISYIAAAVGTEGGSDINSVFVVSSGDGGATWAVPVLVQRSGLTPAFSLRFVRTPNRYHLLWFQDHTGDLRPEAIYHSSSPDGKTWSHPRAAVDRAGVYQSFSVAADRRGRLHLVFHLSSGSGAPAPPHQGYYMVWDSAGWSLPQVLFDWREVGWQIGVTTGAADSVHLVMNVRDYGSRNALVHAAGQVPIRRTP